VKAFRDLAGPMDPEIAKNLRPNTLRYKLILDLNIIIEQDSD